jgi:hypothetical protein
MLYYLRYAGKFLLMLLFLVTLLMNYCCAVHKHHSAVPCPCEKRK